MEFSRRSGGQVEKLPTAELAGVSEWTSSAIATTYFSRFGSASSTGGSVTSVDTLIGSPMAPSFPR